MDKVLGELLHKVCEDYIDDIIIAAESEDDLFLFIDQVLNRLADYGLKAKISKCMFGFKELPLLRYIVSGDGYRMDDRKVEAIVQMKFPMNTKQMKSFLGMVNYFQSFIEGLAGMIKPLYELLKEKTFKPESIHKEIFEDIKERIVGISKLEFINYDYPIIVRTDASDYAIGGVLLQVYDNKEHYIEFYSRSLRKSEINWSVIEKEAFAIFKSILRFACYISGHPVEVQTDHKNLIYLYKSDIPKVNRWRMRLIEFNLNILYIKGEDNAMADALSRVGINAIAANYEKVFELISKFHNTTLGHSGIEETIKRLKDASYDWSTIGRDVELFVNSCPCCQKNGRRIKNEVKQLSLMVNEPFQRIAMDFIGPIRPDLNGNCFILVILDSFTRFVELFPLPFARVEFVAEALMRLACRYGVFEEILSDNGPSFVAKTLERGQEFL